MVLLGYLTTVNRGDTEARICAGTNACYIEQLGRITKWLPHYRPRTPDMVVNIEWPGFQVGALIELAPAVTQSRCETAQMDLAGLSKAASCHEHPQQI